jgi:hypothetical protein
MNAPPLNTPSCFGVRKKKGGSFWPPQRDEEWVFLPTQPTSKIESKYRVYYFSPGGAG